MQKAMATGILLGWMEPRRGFRQTRYFTLNDCAVDGFNTSSEAGEILAKTFDQFLYGQYLRLSEPV